MLASIVLVVLVTAIVVREWQRRKPEPSLEDRIDAALMSVLEAIELKQHEVGVLEDISVSLLALMDEVEIMRWE